MKITIYEPKPEEEKELCLRLVASDDHVRLDAVDPDTGERLRMGTLLSVRPGAGVRLHERFVGLGLPLDDEGRVKVIDP